MPTSDSSRRLPDFVVVGARKAGTTSLHEYLAQHPDVFMPPKGVYFFSYGGDRLPPPWRRVVDRPRARTWDSYARLFRAAGAAAAVGETSESYLHSPEAAERISSRLPDCRIVVLLRNPVRRAWSAYTMMVRNGVEARPPEEAMWPGIHAIDDGFYHGALRRFVDHFPADRLHVGMFEDFRADPVAVVREVFRFVGVDDGFEPDTSLTHNPGGLPASPAINRLYLNPLVRAAGRRLLPRQVRAAAVQARNRTLTAPPPMPPAIEQRLTEMYRDDILATSRLLGRDLSPWLSARPQAG